MSRQCKTKASKGPFRSLGDKGRDKVTRGRTKGVFFLSGLKKIKKTFDSKSKPITFHFVETKPEQNQIEKTEPKKPSMMDIIREKRRQARSDMMVRRHANLGNTSVRKRNS